jgi:hypothetical protein
VWRHSSHGPINRLAAATRLPQETSDGDFPRSFLFVAAGHNEVGGEDEDDDDGGGDAGNDGDGDDDIDDDDDDDDDDGRMLSTGGGVGPVDGRGVQAVLPLGGSQHAAGRLGRPPQRAPVP